MTTQERVERRQKCRCPLDGHVPGCSFAALDLSNESYRLVTKQLLGLRAERDRWERAFDQSEQFREHLLAKVKTLEAERDTLQQQVTELRNAIHPTADASWQHKGFVSLAAAHREDTEMVDSLTLDGERTVDDGVRAIQQQVKALEEYADALEAQLTECRDEKEDLEIQLIS